MPQAAAGGLPPRWPAAGPEPIRFAVKMIAHLSGLLLLLLAGLCLLVLLFQRGLIYYPVPAPPRVPAERLRLAVDGAELNIWVLHPASRDAIVYFGGNAEDVSGNIPAFRQLFPQRAVYLVNYRGYGGSSGRPSEAALLADARQVYDSLAARHRRIALVGRSLGAGVAADLAAHRPVDRLVLVTPFDSLGAVAQGFYPFLPMRWLIRDRYDSAARAPAITAPVLLIIAEHDEIIRRPRSEALRHAFREPPPKVVVIPGVGHNDLDAAPEYHRSLAGFLRADGAAEDQ